MIKTNVIPDPPRPSKPGEVGIGNPYKWHIPLGQKPGSRIKYGMTTNSKFIIPLVVITIILVVLAIVATLAKSQPKSSTQPVSSPTPMITPGTQPIIINSPTPATEKRWSDPLGFLLSYTEGVSYLHQNDITKITSANNQNNFVIRFCLECTLKCTGDCSQKSTVQMSLGSYSATVKKVYPDTNNQYTLSGSVAFPSTTSNKPLLFFITYTGSNDLIKINEVLASFHFTEDYKIPQSEAVNNVRNEQEVRDLVSQYGDEISIVNLYEDTVNKTWVVGVLRKPEDEPVTTIHQYAVDKFTGDVKLLF